MSDRNTALLEAQSIGNQPKYTVSDVGDSGGHSNETVLKRKVDHWKKQLLDLSKRNRMINYRETKLTTLKILEPEFTELFNRLAVSEDALTFQRPIDKDSDFRTFSMLSLLETLSYPIPVHMGDIKAGGSLLERRNALHNLRSKSKLAREEQGTNILYLSFGFIEWRESSDSKQWLKSPVLMMPVSLKQDSLQSPYTLLRYDDEIEVNPTLDYLFNERYGIDLPAFELNGEESIGAYMQTIGEIADQHGWKLIREVSLGLLSFLKISMYHDLNNHYERILKNPVIKAITGDSAAVNNIPKELDDFAFDIVSPSDCYQVVNSDSSQQEAILLSKAGVSFVMQGPPGTGKSQTITNIIAEALAAGKTILFVSEKAAALHVVHKRLTDVGLDDFCLALHSHKANKRQILDSIAANLNLPHKKIKDSAMYELTELFQHRQALNQYAAELHEEILPLGKSLYDAFGEISALNSLPDIRFPVESPEAISKDTYHLMLYRVECFEKALKHLGTKLSENPWRGTTLQAVTQQFKEEFSQIAERLATSLPALDLLLADGIAAYGLNEVCTWAGARRTLSLLQAIARTPAFPADWAEHTNRRFLLDNAKNGHLKQQAYVAAYQAVLASFHESVFSEDLTSWLQTAEQIVATINGITERTQSGAEVMAQADCYVHLAQSVIDKLQTVLTAFAQTAAWLPCTATDTFEDAVTLARILELMEHCPAVHKEWFDSSALQRTKQALADARNHSASLVTLKHTLLQAWEPSALTINAEEMLLRFKTQYTSFLKRFKSSYRADCKTIRGLSRNIGAKFTDADIVSFLQQLGELNREHKWFLDNNGLLTECFGAFYAGEQTDWSTIETGISFTENMRSLFRQQVVPEQVIRLLCDQAEYTAAQSKLRELSDVLNQHSLDALSGDLSKVSSGFAGKDIRKKLLPGLSTLLAQSRLLLTSIAHMKPFETEPIPDGELLAQVTKANRIQERYLELAKLYSKEKEYFGGRINGLETNWASLIADLESVSALFSLGEAELMTDCFVSAFCDDVSYRSKLSAVSADLEHCIAACEAGYAQFSGLFEQAAGFDELKLNALAERVNQCLGHISLLDRFISCLEAKSACDEMGLAEFTAAIVRQDHTTEDVVGMFQRGFLSLWVQSVIGTKKTVEQFRRHNREEQIKRFITLDDQQLLIAQERIRQTVIRAIPDTNRVLSANDELSILLKEVGKKRRIMPLRKLFQAIPNLLLKLKPCMMMSPLSVAYFMAAESYAFDMVIFDEASQIFPQDAIGSIFRGKQVIIAGDSKQLPPSNFFSASTSNDADAFDTDEEEAETIGTETSDSILEETAGVLPNRTLLWHYRSKHESLIAFSNQEIYQNQLVTFPGSVKNGADTGVEFVHVEDGIYEGKGRNTAEARRCVELVRRHIDHTPGRSLGIIAFSENQQKTITLELQKFRERHPEYEHFFTEDTEEEFFVKNLENVQGDERDTILFSVSYAKTKDQRDNHRPMAMRFGPLGQKGGERRLNVAITRARCNVKLVSSILPSDIDLSRTESEGVTMLRRYMEYAMNGSSTLTRGRSHAQKDAFLDVVAKYLIGHGYSIQKYVGCSEYQIDLAVVHPDNEHRYAAGIECDGYSYASARTARDRDHLRKSVLEAMGWRMYRVWSAEWMVRKDIEGEKLLAFIEAALHAQLENQVAGPAGPPALTSAASFSEAIEEDKTKDTGNPYGFTEYVEAVWHETPNISQFYGDDIVAEEIKYIVGIEQPIYIDLLYQRMAGAFGNQKTTAPIRNAVERVLKGSKLSGLIVKDPDGFVAMAGFTELKVRVPANGSAARQISYISPDEIGTAMLAIAGQAIGLTAEDLLDATVKALGYARKGERMTACMNNALERLMAQGRITLVDEKIRVMGGDSHG